MPISIKTFSPGPYATNCSVVRSDGHTWIIDAGFEPDEMIEFVREGLAAGTCVLDALILTHAHIDHIAGVADVRAAFPEVPILIHEAEKEWLGDPKLNLSFFSGMPVTAPRPTRLLRDGVRLTLGADSFEVRHTPGHSPGSISLYCAAAKLALVGDALFAGSIGRTDFPGCSFEQLESSIRARLYTLPDDTVIHPGHGPTSTIGREKRTNPFVRPA